MSLLNLNNMGVLILNPCFDIEDVVYLKHDPDRLPRVVVRYTVSKYSTIYELALGDRVSNHYDFEITKSLNDCIVM